MAEWVCIEEGVDDIHPRYEGDRIREHIIPGTFPRRYWLIAEVNEEERPRVSHCERCQREIKPMYRYCYRCFNYIEKKKRIAA